MNAESYLPFVRKIANRIARRVPHSVEIDDLMGAGTVGLLEALDRFDPASGRSFETYAEFRVKGAILDELRRADPLNRTARSTQRRVAAKTAQLTSAFGRPPETEEVAAAMNTSVDAFVVKMSPLDSYRHVPLDLDAMGPEGEVVTQEDLLGKQEIVRLVRDSVAKLTERQQLVLSLYYVEELSQAQIGEMLGVTESRVCQILGETVKGLRARVSHATA